MASQCWLQILPKRVWIGLVNCSSGFEYKIQTAACQINVSTNLLKVDQRLQNNTLIIRSFWCCFSERQQLSVRKRTKGKTEKAHAEFYRVWASHFFLPNFPILPVSLPVQHMHSQYLCIFQVRGMHVMAPYLQVATVFCIASTRSRPDSRRLYNIVQLFTNALYICSLRQQSHP